MLLTSTDGPLVTDSISSPTAMVPVSSHPGPLTAPGTLPRRNSTMIRPKRHSSRTSTENRRVSDASTLSSTITK